MSINKALGFPVNRFIIMARAAIRGINVHEGMLNSFCFHCYIFMKFTVLAVIKDILFTRFCL